jgi:hypothetical protein
MDRLWIIKADGEEFGIGLLDDAVPLAYAFLTDSDCYGVRIEHHNGTTWEGTREAWARLIERLGEERE